MCSRLFEAKHWQHFCSIEASSKAIDFLKKELWWKYAHSLIFFCNSSHFWAQLHCKIFPTYFDVPYSVNTVYSAQSSAIFLSIIYDLFLTGELKKRQNLCIAVWTAAEEAGFERMRRFLLAGEKTCLCLLHESETWSINYVNPVHKAHFDALSKFTLKFISSSNIMVFYHLPEYHARQDKRTNWVAGNRLWSFNIDETFFQSSLNSQTAGLVVPQ